MAMEPPVQNAVSPRGDAKQQMPPKFSRYRSVRKAAANHQIHEPSPPPPLPSTNPTIARSMSRYRRNKPNPSAAQSAPPVPPLPTQPIPQNNQITEEEDVDSTQWKNAGWKSGKASRDPSVHSGNNNAPHDPPMEARILDMAISSPTKVNGDFMDRGRKGYKSSSGQGQCGFYSDEEREEESRKNQKSRTGERSRERNSRRTGHSRKEPEESVPEIPQNYRRGERRVNHSSPEKHAPMTLKEKLSMVARGGRGEREQLKNMISSPKLMDPEEGAARGTNEQTQTPAADPGARKVLIQYNGFSVSMPITATTTPKNALAYAAEHLSDDVDPNTSFLMESFSQLELDRPVRMYENILDILNSWASDSQNFLVVSLTRDGGPQNIQPGGAPLERPVESSFHVYHSSRPGKWNKRWVTLRSDGQVVVAKKLGVDQANICHLSDYDIYTPTAYQISKKIKSPKKICFAIKSQQKSNLFLNTENFVHYVCSNDATTIDALYKAVQEWRSWYLGYTLGKIETESKPASGVDRSKSSKASTPRTSVRLSEESGFNNPMGFKNLLSRNARTQSRSEPNSRRNSQRSSSQEPGNQNGGFSRRVSNRGRGPPPASRNASRLSDEPDSSSLNNGGTLVKGTTPEEVEEATFAPTGLLGRTYSQRQKAQREREQAMAQDSGFDGPFSRTGLINNSGKNTTAASTPTRRSLVEPPPGGQQPLVDLTPVYKEPIHHHRKGRGIKVEPGQQLVEAATGREVHPGAIVIPSATTFSRTREGSPPPTRDFTSFNPSNNNNNTPNGGSLSRKNTTRTTSRHRTTSHPYERDFTHPPLPTSITRPSSPEGPFASDGLLARSGTMARAQGAASGGRGIATGNRNATSKPLLDLTHKSEFVQGSLLHRVENWDDGNGNGNIPEPIIDRDRSA